MSNITMIDLKVLKTTEGSLQLSFKGRDEPLTLEVTKYDRGVIIHIPWFYREQLGSPGFEALKRLIRPHYKGSLQTRTENDPRFANAARARGEKASVKERSRRKAAHAAG